MCVCMNKCKEESVDQSTAYAAPTEGQTHSLWRWVALGRCGRIDLRGYVHIYIYTPVGYLHDVGLVCVRIPRPFAGRKGGWLMKPITHARTPHIGSSIDT